MVNYITIISDYNNRALALVVEYNALVNSKSN